MISTNLFLVNLSLKEILTYLFVPFNYEIINIIFASKNGLSKKLIVEENLIFKIPGCHLIYH